VLQDVPGDGRDVGDGDCGPRRRSPSRQRRLQRFPRHQCRERPAGTVHFPHLRVQQKRIG